MKSKYKIVLLIILLNITLLSSIFNVGVRAQQEYTVAVDENDEFIWEVTILDISEFERILGFEPAFTLGDRIRMIVREVYTQADRTTITVEFWDYKMDWTQPGTVENLVMNINPSLYDDYIFSFTPVDDYLSDFEETAGAEYSITSNSISKVIRAATGRDYIKERIYDRKGVPITETIYEYNTRRILVRVESGLSLISSGFYFIGFIAMAFIAIILITLKKKRINFYNR